MNRRDWQYVPDACLERIVAGLPPRHVATLRLVCKAFLNQISASLNDLKVRPGSTLDAVPAAFPCLRAVTVTLVRGSADAPALRPLASLRALKSMVLAGPDPRPYAAPMILREAALAQAAALPHLRHLTLIKVTVDYSSAGFTALSSGNLQYLRLRGVKLHDCGGGGGSGGFCEALAAFTTIETLEIDNLTVLEERISMQLPQNEAKRWPEAIAALKNLTEVRLGGPVPLTDALCAALASLPRLSSLSLSRPEWELPMPGAPASTALTEDGGLAALAGAAATLRRLEMRGCFQVVTNAAIHHLAALTALTALDFRTYCGEEEAARAILAAPGGAVELREPSLSRLAALSALQCLHLGGWPLSVPTTRALGRLPSLTRLEFSSCPGLGDAVAFELAKMRRLRHLGLRQSVAVTDIGLAALAKGPLGRSLTALDLSNCHKNITDQGLAAIAALKNLQSLNLSGCDLVSDAGVAAAVPALRRLRRLALSDTRVTDSGIQLIARTSPNLQKLWVEHCPRVTDRCAAALSGLRCLDEVRAFGSGIGVKGALMVEKATGAQCLLRKPCWWARGGTAAA